MYILVLSYSVSPTVWGHDHSAHWPNCMTTHHWLMGVLCMQGHSAGQMMTPHHWLCPVSILAIWGQQVIHCEGQLQAWVRSECVVWPLLGPAAAAGVLVAALSHSSATTELRCTHTLQQGETSTNTATATLHIGSYVAKYFKQILQPISQQNEILTFQLIMIAF